MSKRIEQLDSIRGLAAFAVVLSHLPIEQFALPYLLTQFLKATGVINGHNAVMLFFVLSGFVLSIPFLKTNKVNYSPYFIKRVFRIYIPYLVGICFAIAVYLIMIPYKITGINAIFDLTWRNPLSVKLFFEHIYLIGNIHANSFDGVIWSLIHELRISLIFPFVVLFVRRFNWKVNISFCLLLSFITALNDIFHFETSLGNLTAYFDSFHFLSIFILGVMLAKHRVPVITFIEKISITAKMLILVLSMFLYNFSSLIFFNIYRVTGFKFFTDSQILQEYGMALGAIGFFMIAMGSTRIASILMAKPIAFLGKISYSLYLYHFPIIITCVFALYGILPVWLSSVIGVVIAMVFSSLAWKYVEDPSNKIGKKLAEKAKVALIKKTKKVVTLTNS